MEHASRLTRIGGIGLTVGGVGFALAGALHPQGSAGQDFREAIISMLRGPSWPAAHWIALTSALVLAWTVWLLVDGGWTGDSVAARAGARLAIAASLFMAVQFAVEIAARGAVEAYAAGEAAPLVRLVDPMQAAGWPAFGMGFALLALGVADAAPRWVRIVGAVGAVGIGLGGLLVQGLHLVQFGLLFALGHLLAFWMVWAGIRLAGGRGDAAARADRLSAGTPAVP